MADTAPTTGQATDTMASGVEVADTDYRYQGMADSFISANTMQRDFAAQLGRDAMGSLSKNFTAMNVLVDNWIGSIVQTFPSIIAAAIGNIGAISSDDALMFVKVGAALSNSASPPVPGYQNLGTAGPGQSQGYPGGAVPGGTGINLPSKSTVTVTTP